MIREIGENKLLNTKVKFIPGSYLANLNDVVVKLSNEKPCDRLVIVMEGNYYSHIEETITLVNRFNHFIDKQTPSQSYPMVFKQRAG